MSGDTQGGPSGPSSEEPVGSVGEEAAKLLGAFSEWASEHTQDVNEHLATGSAECLYCPVCRAVHAVRSANPEVRTQLLSAAQGLLQAASGLLAAAESGTRPGGARPAPSSVQHIDLDDDVADESGEDLVDDPDQGQG